MMIGEAGLHAHPRAGPVALAIGGDARGLERRIARQPPQRAIPEPLVRRRVALVARGGDARGLERRVARERDQARRSREASDDEASLERRELDVATPAFAGSPLGFGASF